MNGKIGELANGVDLSASVSRSIVSVKELDSFDFEEPFIQLKVEFDQ